MRRKNRFRMSAGLGWAARLLVELREIQSGGGGVRIRLYGAQQVTLNLVTLAGKQQS